VTEVQQMEWDEADEQQDEAVGSQPDPDYLPNSEADNSSVASEGEGEEREGFTFNNAGEQPQLKEEKKYIIFWSSLVKLLAFYCCSFCGSRDITAARRECGTLLIADLRCRRCHRSTMWHSQPYLGTIPAGNILLSAAIMFSGAAVKKTLQVLHQMGVAVTSTRTYFRHQKEILQDAVRHVWKDHQEALFAGLQAEQQDLTCGGDGRADSPGHCAKYGTYTLMELEKKVIIDVQVVQVQLLI